MHRSITAVGFDKVFARSRQLPAEFIETTMLIFTALVIVACLRIAGIILVISMLTIPQMTAMLFTHSYKRIKLLSILLGYIASLGGLFLSFALDTPGGASVILCSLTIYAICAVVKKAIINRNSQ